MTIRQGGCNICPCSRIVFIQADMSLFDEKQLVRRAQRGDREAAGVLWNRLTPKLYGYLINVTRDKQLSEDILQNTWLAALSHLAQYRFQGTGFGAWLFAIARNECNKHWRNEKREVPLDPVEHDFPTYEHKQSSDERLMVEAVLAALSEEDRELIRLRYIADLSVNEIAHILNINSVAVRVRLHRALRRSRSALTT